MLRVSLSYLAIKRSFCASVYDVYNTPLSSVGKRTDVSLHMSVAPLSAHPLVKDVQRAPPPGTSHVPEVVGPGCSLGVRS